MNWDSLAVTGYAHLYDEGFTKVYFDPIMKAFKSITADDLGKDSLKKNLKKIVIKNEAGNYSGSSAYSFSNDMLTIDHQPVTNIEDIDSPAEALEKLLGDNM